MEIWISLTYNNRGEFQLNKKMECNKEISPEIKDKWQKIVDIIAKTAGASDALITKVESSFLKVLKGVII